MIGGGDAVPLRARGLIGDTGTAALVAADGTIDWWCPGRFDAPAALYRLLDPAGGAVRVGPAGPRRGTQSYDERTNVLRTVLPAPEADVELVDFMPWDGARPTGRIVRIATVRRGRAVLEVDVVPGSRFGPGRDLSAWSEGVAFDGVAVRAACPFDGPRAVVPLEAGERLVVTVDEPGWEAGHHEALSVDAALDLLDRTTRAWRRHLLPVAYEGPYRAAVERSFLVLKAMRHSGSGALVGSVTTSLPQRVGGERNWDHRFAWVRDAALGFSVAADLGMDEEADGLAGWLAALVRDGGRPLPPFSRLDGTLVEPEETELPRLAGRLGSQPVRTGRLGADRRQLDLLADLVDGLDPERPRRGEILLDRWDDLVALADWAYEHWSEPDRGVWELRSDDRQLVASKLSCWWALQRLALVAAARNPLDLDALNWRIAARDILAWVDGHGLDRFSGLRLDDGGDGGGGGGGDRGDMVDAALLRVAWRSPWPLPDHRVTTTVARVLDQLSTGFFVHRYPAQLDDGAPPGQGASLVCSFWAVEALAALGRWDEAHERMEYLCHFAGPLGLLPEQAEPATLDYLGNLPEAAGHLALVRAALALARGPR